MLDGEKADIESLRKAFANGRTPDELDFLSLIKSCINRQGNGFELVEPLMANEEEAIQGMEARKLISPLTLARTFASLVYPKIKDVLKEFDLLTKENEKLKEKDKDLEKEIENASAYATKALPIGSVILWGLTLDVLPANFVICDGRTVTISGKQYKVPNLVDRFALGIKSDDVRNKEGGKASVVLTIENLPRHRHSGNTSDAGEHSHQQSKPDASNGYSAAFNGKNEVWRTSTNAPTTPAGRHSHAFDTSYVGGDQAHENMPPYCTVYYVIKIAN